MEKKRWEYKVVKAEEADESTFNKLGEDGWELVAIDRWARDGHFRLSIGPVFIFKRLREA